MEGDCPLQAPMLDRFQSLFPATDLAQTTQNSRHTSTHKPHTRHFTHQSVLALLLKSSVCFTTSDIRRAHVRQAFDRPRTTRLSQLHPRHLRRIISLRPQSQTHSTRFPTTAILNSASTICDRRVTRILNLTPRPPHARAQPPNWLLHASRPYYTYLEQFHLSITFECGALRFAFHRVGGTSRTRRRVAATTWATCWRADDHGNLRKSRCRRQGRSYMLRGVPDCLYFWLLSPRLYCYHGR